MTPLPPHLLGLARHRVLSAADAVAAGWSHRALDRLVREERLIRLHTGWYAPPPVGDELDRHRLRTIAHVRARAGRAAASHTSALALLDLPLYRWPIGTVHLTRLEDGHSRRGEGVTVWGRWSEGQDAAPRSSAEVLCVAPAVAIVQAGLVGEPMTALIAADAALHRGLTTRAAIDEAVTHLQRRAGAGLVRQMLTVADGRRESPGESRTAWLLGSLGFAHTPQVEISDGSSRWRVDFLLDEAPVIVEFDGAVKYADRSDLVREKVREDALRALGYEVVRLTWRDLAHPDLVRSKVEAAIRRARARRATASGTPFGQ
ncbi:type IV toxin-antitoxin system AbiEi family antitoxin domain-containing protein [Janibacter sp. G1551]|uniref:type IV toxin-antitoxin system AbiEi family antitoxin domain-containing protein n=1 Tax=Janibacter sp. G1551 TaxID=3420440 RepID=UPI003D0378D1